MKEGESGFFFLLSSFAYKGPNWTEKGRRETNERTNEGTFLSFHPVVIISAYERKKAYIPFGKSKAAYQAYAVLWYTNSFMNHVEHKGKSSFPSLRPGNGNEFKAFSSILLFFASDFYSAQVFPEMCWPKRNSHFKRHFFCSFFLSLFFVLVVANEIAGVNPEKAFFPPSPLHDDDVLEYECIKQPHLPERERTKKVISCLFLCV